jgi:hypothetical protein
MRGIQTAFLGFVSMTSAAFGQDKATIDKLNESFMAAFQKGDTAAIGQCMRRTRTSSLRWRDGQRPRRY